MLKLPTILQLITLYLIVTQATSTTTTSSTVTVNTITNTITSNLDTSSIEAAAKDAAAKAKALAEELYKNATAYAKNVLAQAEDFATTGGILADTVSTSLALIGLGASYTTYAKMQIACDAHTYINHYSQCLIHKFAGYWCCAKKNLSTGTAICKAYSNVEAKALVALVTNNSNNFKYYCNGRTIQSVFGILAFIMLALF